MPSPATRVMSGQPNRNSVSAFKQHGSLPEQFENRIAALSVHHADYVQGFGSLHAAAP
ncbi:hypothetical protein SAMN04487981_102495 [Streptomyces sp. cf386]|nr:hypothetical protein SAMN04487981_102495 [Streptomyces sp. cf386]